MRIDRDDAGSIGVILVSTALVVMNMSCASSGSLSEGTGSTAGVFNQGEVDSPARLLACGNYQRPRGRVGTSVEVSFVVNSDGTVEQVAPRSSGRDQLFVEEAVELGRQCVFEPARIGDQPVAVRSGTRFYFTLPPRGRF
jgi:TonB family protein